MASTCGFSSGFSTGFCVAVAVEDPPVARGGTGLGGPPRRLLRRIELEGHAVVAVIGRGELSLDLALAGAASVDVRGTGRLALVQALQGAAQIAHEAAGSLKLMASMAGGVMFDVVAAAVLVWKPRTRIELEGHALLLCVASGNAGRTVALSGMAAVPATASGVANMIVGLGGWTDLTVEAWGDVLMDDEETALALLGLPSEVLV